MVGVPNRKKCHCCRRRKIKCDEERPSCGQCRKAAIACQGYDAAPVFKNQSASSYITGKGPLVDQNQNLETVPPSKARGIKWRQLETPHRRRNTSRRDAGHDPIAVASPINAVARFQVKTQALRAAAQSIINSPCPPVPLHSWSHDSLIEDFITSVQHPAGSRRRCIFAWLQELIAWKEESDVTRLALTALATGWAGRVDARPDLVDKGLQMYGAAADRLCREIPRCRPPLILATTGVFIVYELFEFGAHDNAGWSYHMAGAAASARAAASLDISAPPFLHVFDFCRLIFMIKCFRARRRHDAVRMNPVEASDLYEDEFKSLIRLGFEAVGLLEMADALELGLPHQNPRLVVEQLFRFLAKLVQWKESSALVIKEGPVVALGQKTTPTCGLKGFPGRLKTTMTTPATGQIDPFAYDYAYDMRVMQMYHTIRLNIFLTLLGNSSLRPVMHGIAAGTGRGDETLDEEEVEEESTPEEVLAIITNEADAAARTICTYAQLLCPTVGATLGYMFELWAMETVDAWHTYSSGDKTASETRQPDQHYINVCRQMIPLIKQKIFHPDFYAEV